MKVAIRADASLRIGAGHVVRCLTLAKELRRRRADVMFVCGVYEGNLCNFIEREGFAVSRLNGLQECYLAAGEARRVRGDGEQHLDAECTIAAIGESHCDWLIVDHYALDTDWETMLRPYADHLMVIDDLADRKHNADLFLDQNYNSPLHERYMKLLPDGATLLLGSDYSLVRHEFYERRNDALARRCGDLNRLMVFMGGGDIDNDTATVLEGLATSSMNKLKVDVIIGAANPYMTEVKSICAELPAATLHIQTSRMAELMFLADCAINAAGSTTWERCTLGLPALVAIQSDDQVAIANAVHQKGGHRLLGWANKLTCKDYADAIESLDANDLLQMSEVSAGLCDGRGVYRVADQLFKF